MNIVIQESDALCNTKKAFQVENYPVTSESMQCTNFTFHITLSVKNKKTSLIKASLFMEASVLSAITKKIEVLEKEVEQMSLCDCIKKTTTTTITGNISMNTYCYFYCRQYYCYHLHYLTYYIYYNSNR